MIGMIMCAHARNAWYVSFDKANFYGIYRQERVTINTAYYTAVYNYIHVVAHFVVARLIGSAALRRVVQGLIQRM